MIITEITDAARQIPHFKSLPVTVQITLLFPLIDAACNQYLPLKLICAALNDAGSVTSIKYLRSAISVVRLRLKKTAIESTSGLKATVAHSNTSQQQTKISLESSTVNAKDQALTPKQRREQNAVNFVSEAKKPLF